MQPLKQMSKSELIRMGATGVYQSVAKRRVEKVYSEGNRRARRREAAMRRKEEKVLGRSAS